MKKKKYGLPKYLFLSFAILIAAVVFYVYWIFDVKKQEADVRADIPERNREEANSDISGWEVYQSKDRRFRIDYPGDWKVQTTKFEDLSTHSVYFGEPVNGYYPVMINFDKKPSEIPLKDWVEENAYFSGTFKRGAIESRGMLSNFYIDEAVIGGKRAYRTELLSDTYFIPKMFSGKLDDLYGRCKCDYDEKSVYLESGDTVISITHINNMNGKETVNHLVEKNGRYEVESSDNRYLENKKVFSDMISSFRFTK